VLRTAWYWRGSFDIGVKVVLHVTAPCRVLLADVGGGFARGEFVELLGALDAPWPGGDEADVEGVFVMPCDDVGAAAKEDDVAETGEA